MSALFHSQISSHCQLDTKSKSNNLTTRHLKQSSSATLTTKEFQHIRTETPTLDTHIRHILHSSLQTSNMAPNTESKIWAPVPSNDINQHDAAVQAAAAISSATPKVDNSGKIGHIPAVQRKLEQEQASERSQGTKPRLIDDVRNFLDPKKHPGAPDNEYNTFHRHNDINAPNGGARGVAPDSAYQP